jgi:hypothetical protein
MSRYSYWFTGNTVEQMLTQSYMMATCAEDRLTRCLSDTHKKKKQESPVDLLWEESK